MENEKLPDNILNLSILKLNRDAVKICRCENRVIEIDTVNRLVRCGTCGMLIDPFDALVELCNRHDEIYQDTKRLLEYQRQITNYKPYLRVIKNIESHYHSGKNKMLPICPSCGEPFYLEELASWTNEKFAHSHVMERMKKSKENN